MQKGSLRWQKLQRRKKQLRKLENQIRVILHKQTTALVYTLNKRGVQTVAISDVRDLRKRVDDGSGANQQIDQLVTGKFRWLITLKAEQLGMCMVIQNEAYSSLKCPRRRDSAQATRAYVCLSSLWVSLPSG